MYHTNSIMYCFIFFAFLAMMRSTHSKTFTVEMPSIDTLEEEAYVCRVIPFSDFERAYIVGLHMDVDRSRVHHLTTSVCEEAISKEEIWGCKITQGSNCIGASAGFGGWDKYTVDKHDFKFPNDLSIEVGSKTRMKNLVLQLHYTTKQTNQTKPAAKVVFELSDYPTRYQFQLYTIGNRGYIPSNTSKGFLTNVACRWELPSVKAYRYRVHTHHIGFHVEAFLIRNGTWILLGSALSQAKTKNWYEVLGGPKRLEHGDILAARCLYINSNAKDIHFGMENDNEMCSFSLELGYRKEDHLHFGKQFYCEAESPSFRFSNFPSLNFF